MTHYFLAKTDPETYSIYDLQKEGTTNWDGIHSYQALQVLRAWKKGDKVFVYHSIGKPAIVGLMEVVGEPVKDSHDARGISWYAPMKFVQVYDQSKWVSLADIKSSGLFNDFALVRQSRLSTMACPDTFTHWVLKKVTV